MTDYMDGNIHEWNGGDCPVPERCTVNIWLRNGDMLTAPAEYIPWHHGRHSDQHPVAIQVTTRVHVHPDFQHGFEAGRDAAVEAVRLGVFPIMGFYDDLSPEAKAAANLEAAAENRVKALTPPGNRP